MAETLGSLCDKITIIKLKLWHCDNNEKEKSLNIQEKQLIDEINEYILAAISGEISFERLTFDSNKIYKKEGNFVNNVSGSIGKIFSDLADVNCELWHEQENVYDFENISVTKKDQVVKKLALLNLKRNKCIDGINNVFKNYLENKNK